MADKRPEPAPRYETIADLLAMGADDSTALLDVDGASLTYRELREKVKALSNQLRAIGVRPPDRIAIVLPNGPQMAIAFLAAVHAGCAAPLNPKYRESEFGFYMEDLKAKVLILPEGGHPEAEAAARIDVAKVALSGDMGMLHFEPDGSQDVDGVAIPGGDDVALVLHTSGTTSRPKIVPLRQRNLFASARNVAASMSLTESDRSLNVMPLFHIHGLVAGLLAPLAAGGAVVCTPGFEAFKFHHWIDQVRPTFYSAVPTIHQMVLARAGAPRATTLRFVRSSSAALPSVVLDGLRQLFDVPVIEAYGMTEASHQMASNPLPPDQSKPGSVGRPTGIEIAILDNEGSERAKGERGEVSVRGQTIVDAYENNEEANKSSFTAEGWFRTGDEGYFDADGYLFLTGRIKEQINRGGEKVAPLEIDEVLMNHPDIAQAVAFAVPDPVLGEDVAAAVVLREGAEMSAPELRTFASNYLAAFKVPRRIYFVDEIPKGPTGKIQRIGLAKALGLE